MIGVTPLKLAMPGVGWQGGWRDSSVLKNTAFAQSLLRATVPTWWLTVLDPGDPMSASDSPLGTRHTWCTHRHAGKAPPHTHTQ